MKIKVFNKNILKRALIIFFCGALFFSAAYAYLDYNLNNRTAKADQKDYIVPYKNIPDNAGIVFLLPDGSGVMAYLDFESSCINVVNIENYDRNNDMYYGYTADYVIEADYQFIGGIVDRVGGVSIEIYGEILRYTGIQVIDLLSVNHDENIKPQIITQIFNQISKSGFSRDDFVYIIENGEGNLSIIDCIYWLDYIDELRKNITFAN